MKDLLVIAVMGLLFYVAYSIATKQPIIRTKKNLEKAKNKAKQRQQELTAQQHKKILEEVEPLLMDDLFDSLVDIKEGVICSNDDWYTKIVEVIPVNYYLKDNDEQDQIDAQVESWAAQLDHQMPRILTQNRFIDITENIQTIQSVFENQTDLSEQALEYGQNLLADLQHFQKSHPRYDTKRYLLFDYQVKRGDLRVEEDETIQEVAFRKAVSELDRQIMRANQLTKSGVELQELDNVGITELHYHHFQRRRARKLRFKDIQENEMLAMYVTSMQSAEQIALVKEKIDENIVQEKERDTAAIA